MNLRTLSAVGIAVLAAMFVVPAFFGGVGALAIGSGFTFRPMRAALVNRRGQPVSRLRAVTRAAIAWSPIVAILLLMKLGPEVNKTTGWRLALEWLLLAVLAAGAGWAIARPSRGIQDRLTGTWIVPR
jgi:hypothetical protein